MFETKSGIFFIGGIGFFITAFLGNGALPMIMYKDLPEKTAEEVVNPRLVRQFRDLQERWPESFTAAFGELPQPAEIPADATAEQQAASEADNKKLAIQVTDKAAEALRLGRQIYIGEGC